MEIPKGLEIVGLAEPGDIVILRMPPEAYLTEMQKFAEGLSKLYEERGVKFVLLSNNIQAEIEGGSE